MGKYVNKEGHAVKITERGVLAVTVVQDGETLELKPETDMIIGETAAPP